MIADDIPVRGFVAYTPEDGELFFGLLSSRFGLLWKDPRSKRV